MKRALSTWSRPPRSLRRQSVQSDNIALVPASELTSLKLWQERARHLPADNTLLVIPNNNPQLQRVGQRIKLSLQRRGRRALIATTTQRQA